jgi:predicted nuclease with RNAse H fold
VEAIAQGRWQGAKLNDDVLARSIRDAAKTAIDAPFGWPERFVDALNAHRRLETWPADFAETRDAFVRRRTDLLVRERAKKVPLSVSTDRIAYCAMRCAALLGQVGEGVARDGSGLVVEAYPDAALRRWLPDVWAAPVDSYKGEGAEDRRALLLERVLTELGPRFELSAPDQQACVDSDHCLDALICALVARAAQCRKTIVPDTDEDRRLAQTEGWIHLPCDGSLNGLL